MAVSKKYHNDDDYKEMIKERSRVWYYQNKEQALKRMKEYNQEHKERLAALARERYKIKHNNLEY